jgi:hypothetical protein
MGCRKDLGMIRSCRKCGGAFGVAVFDDPQTHPCKSSTPYRVPGAPDEKEETVRNVETVAFVFALKMFAFGLVAIALSVATGTGVYMAVRALDNGPYSPAGGLGILVAIGVLGLFAFAFGMAADRERDARKRS